MNMMVKLGEIKLVTAVGGAVPTAGGHSHHLTHLLLLLLTEGQVVQEAALQLLPGRAVCHQQPLPLLDEGVGQVTYLWTVCMYAVTRLDCLFDDFWLVGG